MANRHKRAKSLNKGTKTSQTILHEMEGKPISQVIGRLAEIMEAAKINVSMEDHLVAVTSGLLAMIAGVARDVGVLMKANGANIDPDDYATFVQQMVLLRAQVEIYDKYLFPEFDLELVEALPVEDEGVEVGSYGADGALEAEDSPQT